MNRLDFQKISKLRLREAKSLLRAHQWHGAKYLCGYAIECALKSCIARKTRRHEFPDLNAKNYYIHNLEKLLELAELGGQLEQDAKEDNILRQNWNVCKGWSEQLRYGYNEVTEHMAADYIRACGPGRSSVITWIRKHW